MKLSRGFTLVELIVTMAIMGILATGLVLNFRSSETNSTGRNQVAHTVISNIRRAQSMATSGSMYSGQRMCGFGISYVDTQSYLLFARPGTSVSCEDEGRERTYLSGVDQVIERITLINPKLKFKSSFPDILFELPFPTTYIDGSSAFINPEAKIVIVPVSGSDTSETIISIFMSGKIDLIQ